MPAQRSAGASCRRNRQKCFRSGKKPKEIRSMRRNCVESAEESPSFEMDCIGFYAKEQKNKTAFSSFRGIAEKRTVLLICIGFGSTLPVGQGIGFVYKLLFIVDLCFIFLRSFQDKRLHRPLWTVWECPRP